MLCIFMKRK